jgi:hypothetical protein
MIAAGLRRLAILGTSLVSQVRVMIRSFRDKETERIWRGQQSRKFPGAVQDRALRKLRQLDASLTLDDLRNPPGNHLEALKRIVQASGAFGSTTSGASAFVGSMARRMMSRSLTITERLR